jgi:N-acetylmuramoyl-L-alanine amidase
MSKIIENFLIPLFVIVSVLYAFNSFGGVELNKAYHHITTEPGYLERANISIYFSGNPQVQEVKNKKTDAHTMTFFFPDTSIAQGECEAMVRRISNQHNGYSVVITPVIKPTKGVELAFNFDPEQCSLCYETFDSIGLQKGIVFRLYNKNVLKHIENNNNQPVLRTLWWQPDGASAKNGYHNKPNIVIDAGHGGGDSGAIGCGGIQEKQVCLAIGTAVGSLLEQKGCSVLLTRKNDCDMQLDERTAYANDNNADLFVSIHANYAANPRAIGIETFCMQPTLLKKNFSCLTSSQDACVAGIVNQRAELSQQLAQSVQRCVCNSVSQFHDVSIDRKVKHSVSQVLLGVQKPAILIEVGFLSHPKESLLLDNVRYQNSIAHGICDGILSVLQF